MVKVQIIQTLSMFINNITNDTAVYFILSNNHINDLIRYISAHICAHLCTRRCSSFFILSNTHINEQCILTRPPAPRDLECSP